MYFKWICAGLAAVGCALARGQTTPGISADQTQAQKWTFEDAQALAGKGRLDQAMNILDQLAVQTPEPAGVDRLRGIIFYQRNDLTEAVAAFANAVAEDAGDRESLEMEGVSLFRLGRPQDALPYLEKAKTAVKSTNVDPEYVLGLCYADAGRYDDARHAFAEQYGFKPDSAEAYLLAGRLFLRRELKAQAAEQARKALELDPKLPLAHQLLGETALAAGDLQTAIQELKAERTIDPLDPELYGRLGDAYLRDGQYDDAQLALNRAVLLEPYSTEPYILLGETFLKMKDPIQALQYLVRAEKMDPSNYITHNLLGQAYKATGQLAEANREFKLVVEIQHRDDPRPAEK